MAVFLDAMHCLDLGVLPLHNGSTLWYLLSTQVVWPSTTRHGRCLEAHAQYSQFCKEHKISDIADNFDEEHIKKDANSYPCLGHLKASEQRWLVYWIHSVLTTLPDDPIQQLILASYGGLIQIDAVCRRNGRHLPDAEKDLLCDGFNVFVECHNALSLNAQVAGERMWHTVPKYHYLLHIIKDFGVNPRAVHNYLDESMIGRIKIIASACHADTMSLRVIERYMCWTAFRWAEMLEGWGEATMYGP